MKNSCNQNNIVGLIEVAKPQNICDVLGLMGLREHRDFTVDGQTLKLISPKSQSIATRVKATMSNHPELVEPKTLEVKFKWKEISYDGLIRDPSKYGPEWDQETVNGWFGGYDTEDAAIQAMVEFKAKHDLRYEYTLMKIYK